MLDITSTTHALVGIDASTTAAGAKVSAGGSLLVSAHDDTEGFVIVGNVAAGAVGVGGSTSVLLVTKDTAAVIGDHATVDAKGHGTPLAGISDGTLSDSGTFGTISLRGIAVDAESTENVFVLTAAGSFGAYVGLPVPLRSR